MQPLDPTSLQIVTYPHPALRYESKALRRVDTTLRSVVERMFELMYAHRGVGLAANQVNLPLRLFIMNPAGKTGEGEEWVFINPVLSRPRGNDEDEEGCLSLPGVVGNVVRPKKVRVHAFDLQGNEIDREFSDYEARIVQHEADHLNGVLFIDRLSEGARVEVEEQLHAFELEYQTQQRMGTIPEEADIMAQLAKIESAYCS
ncbi:MAG: peptide deformylase [Pirellulaceae bacterium]|nr:MAG: peptide deformylase [Pirellulaceae bacterium]